MIMTNERNKNSCGSEETASDTQAPLKPDSERETDTPNDEGWTDAVLRKAGRVLTSLKKLTR